jgi:hypothetical protein
VEFDVLCLPFYTVVQTGLFTIACGCSFGLLLVILMAMDFAMAASVEEGGGLLAVGVERIVMVDGLRDRKGKFVKEGLGSFFVVWVGMLYVCICGNLLCIAVVRGCIVVTFGFIL